MIIENAEIPATIFTTVAMAVQGRTTRTCTLNDWTETADRSGVPLSTACTSEAATRNAGRAASEVVSGNRVYR
jgi:hypothetical protein